MIDSTTVLKLVNDFSNTYGVSVVIRCFEEFIMFSMRMGDLRANHAVTYLEMDLAHHCIVDHVLTGMFAECNYQNLLNKSKAWC